MKVEFPNTTPPGGWRWRAPDGQNISGIAFHPFVSQVAAWHAANGVEFDRGAWEDELCKALKIEGSHCGEPGIFHPLEEGPKERGIGVADLKRFIATMAAIVRQDPASRFVDQSTAEYRANICARCPMNVPVHGCFGCAGIVNKLKEFLGGNRVTTRDKDIQSCQACGCALGAKVWVSGEVLSKVEKFHGAEYHEDCWVPVAVGREGDNQ